MLRSSSRHLLGIFLGVSTQRVKIAELKLGDNSFSIRQMG